MYGGTRFPLKLTPQHLAEVVNALQSFTGNGKGSEKRRAARLEVHGNVVIAQIAADGAVGKSYTAITRDISFVGVGLLQSKPLEKGQQLVVRLPRGAKPPLFMLCVVMHVRPLADGLFVVGAEFSNVAATRDDQLLGKAAGTQAQRVRHLILN